MNKTEYQAPDTAAKAQSVIDEEYQAEAEDILGEKMVLNMGPSHPATHGVLRLELSRTSRVPVSGEGADATLASTSTFNNRIGIRHATLKSAFNWERIQASFGVQVQSYLSNPAFGQTTNGVVESLPSRKNQSNWSSVTNAYVESEVRCTSNLSG